MSTTANSRSKHTRAKRRSECTVASKGRFGIYPADGGRFLFVANEDQWKRGE